MINLEYEIMTYGKKMKNEEVVMMNYGIYEMMKKFNDHVLMDIIFQLLKNGINY
jgi:hypothetical protein